MIVYVVSGIVSGGLVGIVWRDIRRKRAYDAGLRNGQAPGPLAAAIYHLDEERRRRRTHWKEHR